MDIERRDNDKLVEDLRKEADDTEAKVFFFFISMPCPCLTRHSDGRTPQEKRGRAQRTPCRVLEASPCNR